MKDIWIVMNSLLSRALEGIFYDLFLWDELPPILRLILERQCRILVERLCPALGRRRREFLWSGILSRPVAKQTKNKNKFLRLFVTSLANSSANLKWEEKNYRHSSRRIRKKNCLCSILLCNKYSKVHFHKNLFYIINLQGWFNLLVNGCFNVFWNNFKNDFSLTNNNQGFTLNPYIIHL